MAKNNTDATKVEFISIERIEHEVSDMGRIRIKHSDELVIFFLVRHQGQKIKIPITIKDGCFDAARLIPVARHLLHGFATGLVEATKHWSLPEEQVQPDHPKGDGGKAE